MVFFFLFISVFSAVISEIFQAPNQENLKITKYRKLMNSQDLESLSKITIKNNLGEFRFDRHSEQSGSNWKMTSPRKLLANDTLINSIIQSLENLKIRYVYQKDKINLSNFSLNNPLAEITVRKKGGEDLTITLGLINPIDRSTYAMLSNNQAIYHIDATTIPMNTLNLTNLIETRVFPHDLKLIDSLNIYKGTKEGYHQLALKKNQLEWMGKKNKTMDKTKVESYLKHLFDLKSQLILDRMTDEQLDRIKKYLKTPQYTMDINYQNGTQFTYYISQPIADIPGMKLKRWQFVTVSTDDFHHAYVLPKDFLKKLNITENRLKNLDIKKLFY